jgi:hypothetical protein
MIKMVSEEFLMAQNERLIKKIQEVRDDNASLERELEWLRKQNAGLLDDLDNAFIQLDLYRDAHERLLVELREYGILITP